MRPTVFRPPSPRFYSWPQVFAGASRIDVTELDLSETGQGHSGEEQAVGYLLRVREATAPTRTADPFTSQLHLIMTGFEGPLPPKTGDGSAATAQSLKAGIAPSHASLTELGAIGLGAVFFTHLHRQQLASLGDFREPVECLVGHAERPAGSLRFLYSNPLPFAARIQELSFEKAQELAPLGPCMDILGDGSLWAISTPGHTIGSVSYLVMDAKGPILVAGLLATGLRGPRSAANCGRHRELGRFSLQRLHEFLDLHPSVRLAPSLTGLIPAAPRTESGAGVASGSVDDDEFVGGRFE